MESTTRAIRHEELLEQMGWVQSLARSLVRDPTVADDVVQEAYLTALDRPPRTAHSGASLRAWLAAVTRTLARQSVRTETRRHAREAKVARPETAVEPAGLDVVARGEVQRDVVEAVLALAEPYRSTVLLRYLDGLSGPEIAERTGVSHAAVRQRLSRGLKTLRGELDDRHGGDCRAWLAPLAAPLLRPRAETLPAAALPVPTLVGAAAVVLVGVAVWVLPDWGGASGVPAVTDLPTVAAALPELPSPVRSAPEALPTAAPVVSESSDPAPVADAIGLAPLFSDVSGRVVDPSGQPVPDLRVRFEPGVSAAGERGTTLTAFSDADGRFLLEDVPGRGTVLAASRHWSTLFAGDASRPLAEASPLVVVAPAVALEGAVADEHGVPVEGARLTLRPPQDAAASVALDLGTSWPLELRSLSDREGRFALSGAPRLPGARLQVRAAGFHELELALDHDDDAPLELTLTRPAGRLDGTVVDARGAPAAGALVVFGEATAAADDSGAFRLHVEPEQLAGASSPEALVAVLAGHQPGRVNALADERGERSWPARVSLRLGPAPVTLTGRVLGPDGAPLPGAKVWLADPEPLVVEGDDEEGSTERSGPVPAGAPTGPAVQSVEAFLAGHDEQSFRPVLTDGEGRFKLAGLTERPLRLAAMAQGSLAATLSEPVLPGQGELILRLDGADVRAGFAGRVVDGDGRAMPGVGVSLRRPALTVAHTTWLEIGRRAVTDADGRFQLGSCSTDGTALRLDGEGLVPVDLPVPEAGGEAVLVVPARRELRLLLADDRGADRFAVLDGAGEALPLLDLRKDRRQRRMAVPLTDGRGPVLAVSAAATTLVLLLDDEELERRPLSLRPGRVNEIR
jgi:RNA polymerase sigma-70 factor (ECF subfamily)